MRSVFLTESWRELRWHAQWYPLAFVETAS